MQPLEPGEEFVIDEIEQGVAGDALRIGSPGAPLQGLGDGRGIIRAHQLEFLILIVDDLEEEHPAQLGNALGIAINAGILAHDVLDGFYGGAYCH